MRLRDIPDDVQSTHWFDCWREHRGCMEAHVARLTAERDHWRKRFEQLASDVTVLDGEGEP